MYRRFTNTLEPLGCLVVAGLVASCGGGDGSDGEGAARDQAPAPERPSCREVVDVAGDSLRTLESGLQLRVLEEGQGEGAAPGDSVVVHYTGCLTNGSRFDSSRDRDRAFAFRLGTGQVIRGWDEGIQGMKPSEVRLLVIPPELGYGSRGAADVIPPNSTLIFRVELLEVASPTPSGVPEAEAAPGTVSVSS